MVVIAAMITMIMVMLAFYMMVKHTRNGQYDCVPGTIRLKLFSPCLQRWFGGWVQVDWLAIQDQLEHEPHLPLRSWLPLHRHVPVSTPIFMLSLPFLGLPSPISPGEVLVHRLS